MDDTPTPDIGPANWLEVLAESDADIAAGRIVPGGVVQQMLRDSLARLEDRRQAGTQGQEERILTQMQAAERRRTQIIPKP